MNNEFHLTAALIFTTGGILMLGNTALKRLQPVFGVLWLLQGFMELYFVK